MMTAIRTTGRVSGELSGPTVTWHCSVETITGESDGANCYLGLFANRTFWYVVAGIGVLANGGRADCCGRSQRGPAENRQSGGGNVGLQDIYAHFLPVTESLLMYDHFLVALAIKLYLFPLFTYHPIRKINGRVINYCSYQVHHK